MTTRSNPPNIRQLPAVPSVPIWRFSVEQYHQMIRAGILTTDEPIELLEGWLVHKMPKTPTHRVTTKLVRKALAKLAPNGYYVNSLESITLEDSEPEPDVVVVRGNPRNDHDRPPTAQEIEFVVEVADSTLERDRTLKKRLYARAGIPQYWLIDLLELCIEVYTEPTGLVGEPDYQQVQPYELSDFVPVVIGRTELGQLAVRELLP